LNVGVGGIGTITRFEDIEAWQTARVLTGMVYGLSKRGAFSRDYGLRDQMRRAAVSIMANIAEGFESQTQALFIQFLTRSKGSAGEPRAQLYVALDAGYSSDTEFDKLFALADKCSRRISRFISYLRLQPNGLRVRDEHIEF
jgi:four helix bundle protein